MQLSPTADVHTNNNTHRPTGLLEPQKTKLSSDPASSSSSSSSSTSYRDAYIHKCWAKKCAQPRKIRLSVLFPLASSSPSVEPRGDGDLEQQITSGSHVHPGCRHIRAVTALVQHPAHRSVIFSGSQDGTARAWHLNSSVQALPGGVGVSQLQQQRQEQHQQRYYLNSPAGSIVRRHIDWINCAGVHGESGTLLTGSSDGTIKLWADHIDPTHPTRPTPPTALTIPTATPTTAFPTTTATATSTSSWDHEVAPKVILSLHQDYVESLAVAQRAAMFASGSLDGHVLLWDVERTTPIGRVGLSTSHASANAIRRFEWNYRLSALQPLHPTATSVYAVATNTTATMVLSAGSERTVRIWDPREHAPNTNTNTGGTSGTNARGRVLVGHSDNIRALLLSDDERVCVSGSTDTSMRVWDLRMQACLQVVQLHSSVWALAASPAAVDSNYRTGSIYTGGRDGRVTAQALQAAAVLADRSRTIRECGRPVRSLLAASYPTRTQQVGDDGGDGGDDNEKNEEKEKEKDENNDDNDDNDNDDGCLVVVGREDGCIDVVAPNSEVTTVPSRGPRLTNHFNVNSRRYVVSLDEAMNGQVWDLMQGRAVSELGVCTAAEAQAHATAMTSLETEMPSWCSIDTKLGQLAVHLDYPTCFAARTGALAFEKTPDQLRRDFEKPPPFDPCPPPRCEIDLGKVFLESTFADAPKEEQQQEQQEQHQVPNAADGEANVSLASLPPLSPSLSLASSSLPPSPSSLASLSSSTCSLSSSSSSSSSSSFSSASPSSSSSPLASSPSSDDHRTTKTYEYRLPSDAIVMLSERNGITLHFSAKQHWTRSTFPTSAPKWLPVCLVEGMHPNNRLKETIEFKLRPLPDFPHGLTLPVEDTLIRTHPYSTVEQVAAYFCSFLKRTHPNASPSVEILCHCSQTKEHFRKFKDTYLPPPHSEFRKLPLSMNLDSIRKFHWHSVPKDSRLLCFSRHDADPSAWTSPPEPRLYLRVSLPGKT